MAWRRWVGETLRTAVGWRHKAARLLVARDVDAWLRLRFLGAAARSGLATAVITPATPAELAARCGLSDVELTQALLDVGVALGEVRRRGDRYRARGRRLRAVASGDADELAALVEELVTYDGPVYRHLDEHLRGRPPAAYDAQVGDVIARASRVVEPVVGPFLASVVAERHPASVLDVGCGSGVNLRWLAGAMSGDGLTGIDVDERAAAVARANVQRWGMADRVRIEVADVEELPAHLAGPWDLVVLAQNLYYWSPGEPRVELLRRLRELAPAGTVVVVTTTPGRFAFARHLDLALRVTEGCSRLPTIDELRTDAARGGFASVEVRELVPFSGLAAVVASCRPDRAPAMDRHGN